MKKVGDYMFVSKLGQGQFGTVYKATKKGTDEIFAIKSIEKKMVNANSKLRRLFENEMDVMAKINHPNILHLYEYMETGNNYYLVINFCNGGDLEDHVKKSEFLGEEESIYFLKQIMNGFKELHKHKIMHRDFKLANIFLNDDEVVIGDFGFAKAVDDVTTTKLGSPITMAPEVLNAEGKNCRYTNKADLWSIGVCFFQMVFGKTPFNATTMQQLQRKVKTDSGLNLNFPSSPPASKLCKDLITGLLQYDPDKRMEWKEFFQHPIFEQKHQQQMKADQNVKMSVLFRNNEDRVNKLFEKNKVNVEDKAVEFADPEKLEVNKNDAYQKEAIPVNQQEIERAIHAGERRFSHEKRIITFIFDAAKKLRNLSKQEPTIGKAANGFMFVSILLWKKGMIMNQKCCESFQYNMNMFNLAKWDTFKNSPVGNKIQDRMRKDHEVYQKLLTHLKSKLASEIGVQSGMGKDIYQIAENATIGFDEIEKHLKQHTTWLLDFYPGAQSRLDHNLQKEISIGLVHLFLSVYSSIEFEFKNNEGIEFDWISFNKQLNMDFVHKTLERAFVFHKINY